MPSVSIYYAGGNKRSQVLAEAAYQGVRKAGDRAVVRDAASHRGVVSDYAVFYGFTPALRKIFLDYRRQATAVYIDLGYWYRRMKNRFDGYHKICVNNRHPTEYFQNVKHDSKRFKSLGLKIHPWLKTGRKIILAGMSQKAAIAEGLAPFAWEQDARREVQRHTSREIIYRPKPNCIHSRPLPRMGFDKRSSINRLLLDAHAVVTRHSNVAVDALLRGVPVFAQAGAASVLGLSDLSQIENPIFPNDREQWAADLAWCQFNVEEIASGLPWSHLKNEGLIP